MKRLQYDCAHTADTPVQHTRKREQMLTPKKKKERKKINLEAAEKRRGLEIHVKEGLLEKKVMKGEGEKVLPAKVHFTSTDFGRNPSVCEEEEEPALVGGAAALGRLYM